MSKRLIIIVASVLLVIVSASPVWCQPPRHSGQRGCAQETLIYDGWNTLACETTRRAAFTLDGEVYVTRIVAWSNGEIDGGSLAARLSGPRNRSEELMSTEGAGQWQWSERIYPIGRVMPAGDYFVEFSSPSVCQNAQSSGNGFVKVYGCRDYYY